MNLKLRSLIVPAVAAGLLMGGLKANAQVNFTYTSTTVFDDTMTTTSAQGSTTITVAGASDATADNAMSPGTNTKLGAFTVANNNGASTTDHVNKNFTTTYIVSPQGIFTGQMATFIFHGNVMVDVNNSQTNNDIITIDSSIDQTINFTSGTNTLSLTTHGFNNNVVGPGGQPKADGIQSPGGTAGGGFTIHISGAPGQTTETPEPGTVAMLVGMGVSGSAFVLRRRRTAK